MRVNEQSGGGFWKGVSLAPGRVQGDIKSADTFLDKYTSNSAIANFLVRGSYNLPGGDVLAALMAIAGTYGFGKAAWSQIGGEGVFGDGHIGSTLTTELVKDLERAGDNIVMKAAAIANAGIEAGVEAAVPVTLGSTALQFITAALEARQDFKPQRVPLTDHD